MLSWCCSNVGRIRRYNSSITMLVTPPHSEFGSPKRGIKPVRRVLPEKAAQNICFTCFPRYGKPWIWPVFGRSHGGIKVHSRWTPIPRSMLHLSEKKTRAQFSGIKCRYFNAQASRFCVCSVVKSGRQLAPHFRRPSSYNNAFIAGTLVA